MAEPIAAQTTESFIQVAPDSTGKMVRNLAVTFVNPDDGTTVTAYMQVVSIADAQGNIIDASGREWHESILRELRAIRLGISILTQDVFLTDNDLLAAVSGDDSDGTAEDDI